MPCVQIKRAGHWETTSIKISYLSCMPAKFIRRMAGFQKEEGSYVLPRAGYEPPAGLQRQIWPWLEGWLARVQARVQGKGWKAGGLAQADKAAENFLKLLGVLRSVLLQDLAVLQPSMCSLCLLN
jgi:hypothetical protein